MCQYLADYAGQIYTNLLRRPLHDNPRLMVAVRRSTWIATPGEEAQAALRWHLEGPLSPDDIKADDERQYGVRAEALWR
jgi:hypothetical protein